MTFDLPRYPWPLTPSLYQWPLTSLVTLMTFDLPLYTNDLWPPSLYQWPLTSLFTSMTFDPSRYINYLWPPSLYQWPLKWTFKLTQTESVSTKLVFGCLGYHIPNRAFILFESVLIQTHALPLYTTSLHSDSSVLLLYSYSWTVSYTLTPLFPDIQGFKSYLGLSTYHISHQSPIVAAVKMAIMYSLTAAATWRLYTNVLPLNPNSGSGTPTIIDIQ